jgi:hypothetical protein
MVTTCNGTENVMRFLLSCDHSIFLFDCVAFTIATGGIFVNRIAVSLVDLAIRNPARKGISCQIVA